MRAGGESVFRSLLFCCSTVSFSFYVSGAGRAIAGKLKHGEGKACLKDHNNKYWYHSVRKYIPRYGAGTLILCCGLKTKKARIDKMGGACLTY